MREGGEKKELRRKNHENDIMNKIQNKRQEKHEAHKIKRNSEREKGRAARISHNIYKRRRSMKKSICRKKPVRIYQRHDHTHVRNTTHTHLATCVYLKFNC